jgi:hypothetical protein
MKTMFTPKATSKSAPSQSNQTPDGPLNSRLQDITVGRPFSMGYGPLTQSGRSPARGSDESAFMKSQLG